MTDYTFDAVRLISRDTKEAYYLRHPKNPLVFLFLPKEAVRSIRKSGQPGLWSLTIPETLAEKKGLL